MEHGFKRVPALRREAGLYAEALLRCYSVIFFSRSRLFGAALLLAAFAVPQYGIMGLAGATLAHLAARLFGFDVANIRNGVLLFNSLLASLTLAYLENYQPMGAGLLSLLLVSVSVGTLLVSVSMTDLFPRYFALPALSLPFVGVGFMLFHLFHSFVHIPLVLTPPHCLLPAVENLPDSAAGFFQALGAIFFLPYTSVGLLIGLCLLVWSRWAVICALAGYASGILFMQALGMDTSPAALGWIGFNFVFCGIALGGIFLVPSFGSLLMAALSAGISVLAAAAFKTALGRLGIPPLALPLNLSILGLLYALKCRPGSGRLIEIPYEPDSPEAKFRRHAAANARFPAADQPHLQLPFFGGRTVTQGFRGDITHCDEWREALDFEIVDEYGNMFSHTPLSLDGNFLFGTPVLSPCSGAVVKVVADVPDNAVGESDMGRNWGNLVIIRSAGGWHVKLCHLQQGSVAVAEGAAVEPGQLIGRCGNSGRSPVPHLHLQAQYLGLIGGHTMPFRIARYLTKEPDGLRFRSSGIPGKGDTVFPARFDTRPEAFFRFDEAAREYRMNGRAETVYLSFNADGDRVLTSGAASLTVRLKEQTFYTLDYRGSAESLLFYLHLGLPRMPFVCDDEVFWNDHVDLRPLLRPWAAVLLDLISPLAGYPFARTASRAVQDGCGGVCVKTSCRCPVPRGLLRPGCPETVEVELSGSGIGQITVR